MDGVVDADLNSRTSFGKFVSRKDAKLLSREQFKTTSGLTGSKVVTERFWNAEKFQVHYYCFAGPNTLKLLFWSWIPSSGDHKLSELQTELDTIIKTVHFKNQPLH